MKNLGRRLITFLMLALMLFGQAAADVIMDTSVPVYPVPGAQNSAPFSFEDPEVYEEGKLEIWFGKVNVCDAFILRCNGETMMIDGGDIGHGKATVAFLRALGVHHVNYLYNTHHHDDHIDMQTALISYGQLTADTFLTPYERGFNVYRQRKMEAAVDAKGVEYRVVHDGDTLRLGGENGALFQFYRWDGSTDPNYSSLFCKITYGERTALLMADVIGKAQKALARDRTDIPWKSDILKAGHHGYSEQDSLLMKLIDPEFCVITNSRNAKADDQMKELGIPFALTGDGTVYFWTDGKENWYYNRIPTLKKK